MKWTQLTATHQKYGAAKNKHGRNKMPQNHTSQHLEHRFKKVKTFQMKTL